MTFELRNKYCKDLKRLHSGQKAQYQDLKLETTDKLCGTDYHRESQRHTDSTLITFGETNRK